MAVAIHPRAAVVPAPAAGQPIIEVAGLHKAYGRTVAVQDVSFVVSEGEIFSILGPNGAGKGNYRGVRVRLGGVGRRVSACWVWIPGEIATSSARWWGCSSMRPMMKVWELVHLVASIYRNPRDEAELIEMLGLTPKRNAYYRSVPGTGAASLFPALRVGLGLVVIGGLILAVGRGRAKGRDRFDSRRVSIIWKG
jgi:ABC-2 type transport system ATP-binding protein